VSSWSFPTFSGLLTMRNNIVLWIRKGERVALARSCAILIFCMGGGYEGYPTDPGEFWAVSHVFFGLFTMYLDTISWIRGDETIALAHSCKISIVCMGRGMMGTP
jgi:hypothetical protein